MVFQRVDPRLFILEGFQWDDVLDREFMSHAVAPMRPLATNEDLTIVSFHPLLGNELHFATVRNIVREFRQERRVLFRAIMPCHLGQAYVRFIHAYDRDNMVRQGPMHFGNIQISFAKHNKGRNLRRVLFNGDCWLMMVGFLEDYKSERHIQNAISDFGKVILWEESEFFP